MGSIAALAPGKDPMGPWQWQREQSSLLGETRGSLIWTDGNGCVGQQLRMQASQPEPGLSEGLGAFSPHKQSEARVDFTPASSKR